MKRHWRAALWMALLGLSLAASAMEAQWLRRGAPKVDVGRPPEKPSHVHFVAGDVDLRAGKVSMVVLHFRVDEGFHINSHTPADGDYIPTTLELAPLDGLQVEAQNFPLGLQKSFGWDPRTRLDVYQGEVPVSVRLQLKEPGGYVLKGSLRYQACDASACYPPKTLEFEQPVIVR